MSTALTVKPANAEAIERVIIQQGDLSKLSAQERVDYYRLVCESVGLNPLTKPFEYITLNNKLTLYARKDATDQLRSLYQVSVKIVAREVTEGCYVVTAQASFPSGRVDESIGAVPIENLKGENRANAMMKCETKAKRRVTLSACGLGMLDETEIETIPSAKPAAPVAVTSEPIPISRNPVIETAPNSGVGQTLQDSVKVADQPQEAVLSGETAAASTREPGSDDEDTVFEDDPSLEPIDLPRQRALHRAFKDAIKNEEARKTADTWLRTWLEKKGYIDDNGKGSTKRIPMYLFDVVKAEAVKFAESLPR